MSDRVHHGIGKFVTNRAKNKGDRAELEAVELLRARCGDLIDFEPKRMLGAGRKDDIGDLRIFHDVAIQVKSYAAKDLATGLRLSAKGASRQKENAIAQGFPVQFALGMVPIPRAEKSGAVRWLATCEEWPVTLPIEPVRFTTVTKLVTWLKDDDGPHGYLAHPRTRRVATHGLSLTDTVLVAPIEAWIGAYREALAPEAARESRLRAV